MNKGFDEILSRRLGELPPHEPDDALWDAIEAGLETEEVISRRLQELPQYAPSVRAWEAIEAALPAGSTARPSRRLLYLAAAAAAAVILLPGIPWLMRSGHKIVVESEITLREEYDGSTALESNEEDPLAVIENLCKTGVPVCQSEVFREKLELCRELEGELRQLETVISQVGDSPEIIQAIIRIENLKSGTLQELIQMIHS